MTPIWVPRTVSVGEFIALTPDGPVGRCYVGPPGSDLALVAWAAAHLTEVDGARSAYDKRHGPPLRVSVAEQQLAKRRVAPRN